jgi:two-component system sensor histidine kinase KdpD
MAASLGSDWIVVHVERSGELGQAKRDDSRLAQTLRLAETLGAEVISLFGNSIGDEILAYARARRVTRIVIGKPGGRWWRYRLLGSVVDDLVRGSDDIDIYVIRGTEVPGARRDDLVSRTRAGWRSAYLLSVPVVAVATAVAMSLSRQMTPSDLTMIYLVGVVFAAVRLGRGPSMLASLLSVVAFNFFFVPPRFTLSVWDSRYLLTFLVMLAVGALIGSLAGRLRMQAQAARVREQRIASLYAYSRACSRAPDFESVVHLAERFIGEMAHAEVWIFLRDASGGLNPAPGVTSAFALRAEERAAAQWVLDHGLMAGRGTDTLPDLQALYLPMVAPRGTTGVLGLFVEDGPPVDPDRIRLVQALAGQTAVVLEQAELAREARQVQIQAESERLRDALLSSVSHDLRTPLGTISGAASSLADPEAHIPEESRRELAQSICEESERLNRLVRDLLNMTRLESGAVVLQREWLPVEEVVGSALTRLKKILRDRPVTIRVAEDTPMASLDGVLIEQVLVNLIENALKHSPEGAPVEIDASARGDQLVVEVADLGDGIAEGSAERIFEKFSTSRTKGLSEGIGLGLAICKGFVEAHGGTIVAENRPGGGAVFRFAIPIGDGPPSMPPREADENVEERPA